MKATQRFLDPVRRILILLAALALAAASACSPDDTDEAVLEVHADEAEHGEHEDEAHEEDHVSVPRSVRENLGITFVEAKVRSVRGTIRLTCQFDLPPRARREFHAMLPGRIELLVEQYRRVEVGDPLYRLDSPEWQKMQNELVIAHNAMRRSHAELAVAEATLAEARQSVEFLERRTASLAEAQVRKVELEAQLAERRNTLPRLEAERVAAQVGFDSAHARYEVLLDTASSVTGIPRAEIDPIGAGHEHLDGPPPKWRSIQRLNVHAEAAGLVDRIAVTDRGWAETGDLVLDTVDAGLLRFHADALQTEIARFEDGQRARIVPPPGGSLDPGATIQGTIRVGFRAHADQRTVPIFMEPAKVPSWAKAGVTAYLEVIVDGEDAPVVAVPRECVVRDGLETILFRRHPEDPDEVVRIHVEVGASDGHWVEIRGGAIEPGDEVVHRGVYPLMLATSRTQPSAGGGHLHGDGTFHAGEDE